MNEAVTGSGNGEPPRKRRRGTLHRRTVNRLRDMIFEGDIKPGERVTEIALSERLGVSRTPLREAVRVLAGEGLLEPLPKRGARVARLTAERIDELFPVMGALEALAGELACRHITAKEIAAIRVLHQQMAIHHARRELDPYFRLNQQIHESIMMATRNPTLFRIYLGLAGRVRHARKAANISQARWDEAMDEHARIFAALERREGAALAQLLKRHLLKKQEALRDSARRIDGGKN